VEPFKVQIYSLATFTDTVAKVSLGINALSIPRFTLQDSGFMLPNRVWPFSTSFTKSRTHAITTSMLHMRPWHDRKHHHTPQFSPTPPSPGFHTIALSSYVSACGMGHRVGSNLLELPRVVVSRSR
jgi:hypothetical protein